MTLDPAPAGTATRARVVAWLSAFVVLAASCSPGAGSAAQMTVRAIEGTVQIQRDGKTSTVRSNSAVGVGDRLRNRGGLAELRLASGRLFELDDGDVEILSTTSLRIFRGDLLADLQAKATVDAEGTTISAGRGTFRLDRALANRVGVYSGSPRVRVDNSELKVPRLRQVIVAGGVLPAAPKPLRLSPNDRWDRRYLQEVIDLDTRLTNFGRGLEAQLPSATGITLFRAIVQNALDVAFLDAFGGNRRSDVLIALMMALEAEEGQGATIEERFRNVIQLWTEGASWGLIAYEFQVEQTNLFTRLLDSISRAGLAFARPTSGGGGGGGGGTSPSPPSGPSSPGPSPTNGGPPPPPPPPPPPSPCVEQLPPEADDIVGGLIGVVEPSPGSLCPN